AFARAALAGNASDGYGGSTLAVCLRNFEATAEVSPANDFSLDAGDGDAAGMEPLVRAAIARFARVTGEPAPAVRVCVRTNVPRQLGLAGSSAIVIAVLRALAAARAVDIDRDTLAREALAAETDELGIA